MRHRNGFTLIEVSLVLLMIPTLLTVILSVYKVLAIYDYGFVERQNILAVLQLRKRVALGSNVHLKDNRLIMNYRDDTIELICEEDRVVEYNGTLIYLTDLEGCQWAMEQNRIYLIYQVETTTSKVFIGYES